MRSRGWHSLSRASIHPGSTALFAMLQLAHTVESCRFLEESRPAGSEFTLRNFPLSR